MIMIYSLMCSGITAEELMFADRNQTRVGYMKVKHFNTCTISLMPFLLNLYKTGIIS